VQNHIPDTVITSPDDDHEDDCHRFQGAFWLTFICHDCLNHRHHACRIETLAGPGEGLSFDQCDDAGVP
jgi:hypothetical protein